MKLYMWTVLNFYCDLNLTFLFHEDIYFQEIPIRDLSDPLKKKKLTMRLPMLLPHELLNYIHVSLSKYEWKGFAGQMDLSFLDRQSNDAARYLTPVHRTIDLKAVKQLRKPAR